MFHGTISRKNKRSFFGNFEKNKRTATSRISVDFFGIQIMTHPHNILLVQQSKLISMAQKTVTSLNIFCEAGKFPKWN